MTDYAIPGLDVFNPEQYLQQNVYAPFAQGISDLGTQVWNGLTGFAPGYGLIGNAIKTQQGQDVSAEDWGLALLNTVPLGGTASGVTSPGLKALARTMALRRRSAAPTRQMGSQLARTGGSESSTVYGPGTYFAENMPASLNRWREYGNQMSRVKLTPAAALEIARSEGYASPEIVKAALAQSGQPGGLASASISSPAISGLMNKGYIGYHDPAEKVVTSWILGDQKGMGLKRLGEIQNGNWVTPSGLGQRVTNAMRGSKNAGTTRAIAPTSQIVKDRLMKPIKNAKQTALDALMKKMGNKVTNKNAFVQQADVEG